MTSATVRYLVFILLLVAVSAGLTAAHDTGSPHTHDPVSDHVRALRGADEAGAYGAFSHQSHGLAMDSAPVAFLIVPISGDVFPFHWLWHTMNGEKVDERIHLVHEIMHWYDLPHPHNSAVDTGGYGQPYERAQYD